MRIFFPEPNKEKQRRAPMEKDELIAKQQLEIENLKLSVKDLEDSISMVTNILWKPEQWSTKCSDFPKVAMAAIVKAQEILRG